MRVTVVCFARLREITGWREWACVLPDRAIVRDAWRALAAAHPGAAALETSVSSAVNADFATMQTPVHDGDEIAFLPPVSGGAPEPS